MNIRSAKTSINCSALGLIDWNYA